jgi:hypothetical protein
MGHARPRLARRTLWPPTGALATPPRADPRALPRLPDARAARRPAEPNDRAARLRQPRSTRPHAPRPRRPCPALGAARRAQRTAPKDAASSDAPDVKHRRCSTALLAGSGTGGPSPGRGAGASSRRVDPWIRRRRGLPQRVRSSSWRVGAAPLLARPLLLSLALHYSSSSSGSRCSARSRASTSLRTRPSLSSSPGVAASAPPPHLASSYAPCAHRRPCAQRPTSAHHRLLPLRCVLCRHSRSCRLSSRGLLLTARADAQQRLTLQASPGAGAVIIPCQVRRRPLPGWNRPVALPLHRVGPDILGALSKNL